MHEELKDAIKKIENERQSKTVFGEPIKHGNVLIVPVCTVKNIGGGGGGEGGPEKGKDGGGSGFGFVNKSKPVGYIEIKDGETQFISIYDKGRLAAIGLVIFGLGFLRILKYLKKRKRKT